MSVCLSVYLSIDPSIDRSIDRSIYLSIYLSILSYPSLAVHLKLLHLVYVDVTEATLLQGLWAARVAACLDEIAAALCGPSRAGDTARGSERRAPLSVCRCWCWCWWCSVRLNEFNRVYRFY